MKSTYKFTLQKDHNFYLSWLKGVTFSDPFFSCEDGNCTIKAGYSWNGCTCAKDYEETYIASLEHDPLYQYRKTIKKVFKKYKRKLADLHFKKRLDEADFKYKWVYFKGVRIFGWVSYYFFN